MTKEHAWVQAKEWFASSYLPNKNDSWASYMAAVEAGSQPAPDDSDWFRISLRFNKLLGGVEGCALPLALSEGGSDCLEKELYVKTFLSSNSTLLSSQADKAAAAVNSFREYFKIDELKFIDFAAFVLSRMGGIEVHEQFLKESFDVFNGKE